MRAVLAGGTAVVGLVIGSLATATQWTALALGVGAGAILQVIIEVGAYLVRSNAGKAGTWFTPAVIGGLIASTVLTLFVVPALYTLFFKDGPAAADGADAGHPVEAHP